MLRHALTDEERVQGSKAWHMARKCRITGTDAPVIMGESNWKTPYELYIEKVGPLVINVPNYAQQRGLDLEPKARDWFYEMTGYNLEPDVLVDADRAWSMGSFDGIDFNKMVALEIKCPGKGDHLIAKGGNVPFHYKSQLDHLLYICGFNMIYYLSFDGEDGIIIEYERDNKRIEMLIEKELEFFKCMESLTPPELTDRDVVVRTDREWAEACEEYRAIKTSLKYFEERETLVRDKLIRLADDKCSEGSGLRLTKYIRQGTVNYSIIPELKGCRLDTYRKPATTVWKIGEV